MPLVYQMRSMKRKSEAVRSRESFMKLDQLSVLHLVLVFSADVIMMRSLIVSLKTVKPSQWSRECWKILDEFQIRSQRLTNTHHPLSFLVIFSVNSQRWQLYVFCLILLCTYCPPTCYSLHDNITLCGIESE